MAGGFLCVSKAEIDNTEKYAKRSLIADGWKFKAGGKALCPKCRRLPNFVHL